MEVQVEIEKTEIMIWLFFWSWAVALLGSFTLQLSPKTSLLGGFSMGMESVMWWGSVLSLLSQGLSALADPPSGKGMCTAALSTVVQVNTCFWLLCLSFQHLSPGLVCRHVHVRGKTVDEALCLQTKRLMTALYLLESKTLGLKGMCFLLCVSWVGYLKRLTWGYKGFHVTLIICPQCSSLDCLFLRYWYFCQFKINTKREK